MGHTVFDSDPPADCLPVLRELLARLETAGLFAFDAELDELHVWNGSATWNVIDVGTGEEVDVYSTMEPATAAQARKLMVEQMHHRREAGR